jgi:CHRD domain-containing protein/PEP-CTERM motif-containing protein
MKTKKWIPLGALLVAGSLSAGPITYTVVMSGPAESPPNASPGTGSALIIIDSTANTLNIASETFSGLTSGTTASHIHCCTAVAGAGTVGVATQVPTFSGFPLGVTSGSYSMLFDMTQASTWNPAFITASGGTPADAEAALVAGAVAGKAYLNIHTTQFPGGEIRGFLVPVPEPGTLTFAIAALAGLFLVSRVRSV